MIVRTLAQGAKGLLLALMVLLAAYAGWKWGDVAFPRLETIAGLRGAVDDPPAEQVTPEAAEAAAARIRAFRVSDDTELRLESSEVSSLLRYLIPGMLPVGVIQPRVNMAGDRIDIQVSVLPGAMPNLPDLGAILGILRTRCRYREAGRGPCREGGSMLLIRGIRSREYRSVASFPEILAALAEGMRADCRLRRWSSPPSGRSRARTSRMENWCWSGHRTGHKRVLPETWPGF